MFWFIADKWDKDVDFPDRTHRLMAYQRALKGRIYDILTHAWCEERDAQQLYIPMIKRQPAVRYNMSKIVVNDSVSLIFDESHFPIVSVDGDETVQETFARILKETQLNLTMIDAAMRGSVGSVVLWLRILKGQIYFSVLDTHYLTPVFDPNRPDVVLSITEEYKIKGVQVEALGYKIKTEDRHAWFWFKRVWDISREVWYVPTKCVDGRPTVEDTKRTVKHMLGFCPMVWVKNLPLGEDIDGGCTFDGLLDINVELDYLLSQGGRGLKYSSQPTMVIKDDNTDGMKMTAGDAVVISAQGDAKLLETSGNAATSVVEYARALRELALESVGANRADGSKISTAQSGRAMELMNQSLIWLAGKLKSSYGEGALLTLLNMVAAASNKMDELKFRDGTPIGKITLSSPLVLKWPRWYPPTADDRQQDATSLKTLRDAGVISKETAVKSIADTYDIEDVEAELKRIEEDMPEEAEGGEGSASPGDPENQSD